MRKLLIVPCSHQFRRITAKRICLRSAVLLMLSIGVLAPFSRQAIVSTNTNLGKQRVDATGTILKREVAAATITVTNTNDSGAGSLRDAINQANSDGMASEITFNAGLAGQTIHLQSALPPLNENGTTINGDVNGDCYPDIELDGQLVTDDGIKVFSSNNVIRGLIINRFAFNGVNLSGNNNHLECNYIGTDATGTQNRGNGHTGIIIVNNGSSNNQVGPGNIIAFNSGTGVTVADGANFAYPNFTGLTPDYTGLFPVIDFPHTSAAFRSSNGITPIDGSGHPFADNFGARFTGTLNVGATGSYTFSVSVDDQVRLKIDGSVVLEFNQPTDGQATIFVSNGNHSIELDYFDGPGAARLSLAINGPGTATMTSGGNPGLFGEFFQLRIPSERNRITQNSIFGNNGLGIDLDALEDNFGVNPNDFGDGDVGPNTALNFPEINFVTDNGGGSFTLDGNAPPNSTVEIFATTGDDPSGNGEGKLYLTSVTANGGGGFSVTITAPGGYSKVTATATDANGNTSEFSRNKALAQSRWGATQIFSNLPDISGPTGYVTGDLNGDGRLDLVAIGDGSNSPCRLLVLKQNASGNYDGISQEPMGVNQGLCNGRDALALGDVDGDGDLDLIAQGTDNTSTPRLILFLNDGTGTLIQQPDIFGPGLFQGAVALGDVDADGDLDLAASGQDSNGAERFLIFSNNGAGGFTLTQQPSGVNTGYFHGSSLVFGDVDSDGDFDIVISGGGNNTRSLHVYKNTGGQFSLSQQLVVGSEGLNNSLLRLADLDRDGDLDLVAVGNNFDGAERARLVTFQNLGQSFSNSFTTLQELPGGSWAGLAVGDCNGDGYPDVFANGNDGLNFRLFYFQSQSGTLVETDQPQVNFVGPIVFGDFDGDNDLDMVGLPVRYLYTNLLGPANASPGVPSALSANIAGPSVNLTWTSATDTESGSPSLSYEVRLGTAPGQYNRISGAYGTPLMGTYPLSRLSPGQPGRKLSLSQGTYYWQVRAIDTGLRASGWSAEASFSTTNAITVTNANDSGSGSLRDAINQANSDGATTIITFNAALAGQTIQLQSPLPPLTENGTTINGDVNGDCHPDIELNGQLVNNGDGLLVISNNNVIRGLIINRFGRGGVFISGSGAQNNHVECNYIGTDATGTQNRGNGGSGVRVGGGASDNQVGPGNIIAFNAIGGGPEGGVAVLDGGNFAYPNFTGLTPDYTGQFPVINFPGTRGAFRSADGITPIDGSGHPFADQFGARFTGTLTVGATGSYTFTISNPDDQVQVAVDSVVILQSTCCSSSYQTTIPLSSGAHTIEVDYFDGPGAAGFRLDITGAGSVSLSSGAQPGLFGEFFQLRIPSERNRITQNSIFQNNLLGIELDALEDGFGVNPNDPGDGDVGPNTALNFPEFTTVTNNGGGSYSVGGNAPPNSTVELFASAGDPSGHGEGKVFLATTTAAAGGAFASTINVPVGYTEITATATDGNGNTSEFSANRSLVPSLSINDVTVTEGDSGTVNAIFTVTLLNPSSTVSVDYSTANGTAIAGSDYTAAAGTLTLSSASPTQTISIAVNGDTVGEADENFFVNLSNLSGAVFADSRGQCIIINDDPHPQPTISINDAAAPEGNSGTRSLLFTVSMSGATDQDVTVNYNLVDQSATAGSDYVGASGTITLFAGETTHTLAVTIIGDTNVEGNETFRVDLSNPINATLADNQGIGTIIDDEGVTEPPLNTTWQKAQEGMAGIFGAATNGSIYVVVGNSGDIWTSPDGINWTKRSNPDTTSRGLRGVTFGAGQFVAVGSATAADGGSLILTSPDGITWTQRSTVPLARNLTGVAYGNGTYVATTPGGVVLTSPDAITWTQRPIGINQRLNGIAFGGGLFVAVGNERTVVTSPDGINWTIRGGIPTTIVRTLNAVTHDGSKFIAVSSDPSGARDSGSGVMTSPDGINWTQQTVPVNQPLLGVTAAGGLIVAVGFAGPGGSTIITSPDGVNWTSRALASLPAGVSPSLRVATYGPAGFLAADGRGNIFTSPDGITNWVSRTLTTSRGYQSVVNNGTVYCAVGPNGTVATSPDGATWTQQTTPDATAYYFWWSVTYGNGLFVASGISDSIMTSPDGVNWTVRNPATPLVPFASQTSNLTDITYANGLFVAVGEAYPAPGQTIAHIITSPDGITWTTHDPGLPQTIQGYNWIAVAYGNGKFVVALTDFTTGEFYLLTSPDGQNWTRQPSPLFDPYETFLDIVNANGQFVAVGDRIWTSPDGINWTLRFDYSSTFFNGVAYGDGRFIAVGFQGSIYASTNGINWSPQVGATPRTQNAVTASLSGTQFVSVGESVIEYASFTANTTINIGDVTVAEGNSGTVNAVFTVTLTNTDGTAPGAVVNFNTVNGTATTADNDYQANAGTLTFLPMETTKQITVLVNGDTRFESDESFSVHLSNASGATIIDADGTGTITNDDSAPTFAIDDVTHNEGNAGTTSYIFTVTKTGATALNSSVNFTTVDGTATIANSDYQTQSGTLTFLPADTMKTITVLVNGDTTVEPDEAFTVHLSGASGATITDADGTGAIINDDCSFMLSSMSQNFVAAGGTSSVNVITATGCTWNAVSNDGFITVDSGSSGSGNGAVNYSVGANTGPARMGTMTIAGITFTVTQDSGCTFTLDRDHQSFAGNGGNGTVNITASDAACAWTASTTATFIHITSGGPDIGNGAVQYSVDANPGPTIRSDTITIAGHTFTVYQGINFLDVPSNDPFYNEIGKLAARGVTVGCGNGNYCPNDPVTREQMAAFILRAKGEFSPPLPASQRFNDVPPQNVFYNFIDRLAELEITLGCTPDHLMYCPSDPVKREQMSAFLLRGLGEFSPPTPGSQRFTDVPPGNVFYNFIDRLAVLEITLGCTPDHLMYCPNDSVTRAQMAAFLVRAFNL